MTAESASAAGVALLDTANERFFGLAARGCVLIIVGHPFDKFVQRETASRRSLRNKILSRTRMPMSIVAKISPAAWIIRSEPLHAGRPCGTYVLIAHASICATRICAPVLRNLSTLIPWLGRLQSKQASGNPLGRCRYNRRRRRQRNEC